jgi:hypothetical protein
LFFDSFFCSFVNTKYQTMENVIKSATIMLSMLNAKRAIIGLSAKEEQYAGYLTNLELSTIGLTHDQLITVMPDLRHIHAELMEAVELLSFCKKHSIC